MTLKKHCLALAAVAAALTATSPMAAILSVDYAGTVTGGINVNGTISWETTSTGTSLSPSSTQFQVAGISLFVNNVDYSGNLSNVRIQVLESLANQDEFSVLADLRPIGRLPFASRLAIVFFDEEGGIFNGVTSLPSSFASFDGAERKNISLNGTDLNRRPLTYRGPVTVTETVTTTPSVPEPGSLLLVALAGLALGATRRRWATT